MLLKVRDQGCGSGLKIVCLSNEIERDTVGCEVKVRIFPVLVSRFVIIATTIRAKKSDLGLGLVKDLFKLFGEL